MQISWNDKSTSSRIEVDLQTEVPGFWIEGIQIWRHALRWRIAVFCLKTDQSASTREEAKSISLQLAIEALQAAPRDEALEQLLQQLSALRGV